ncbi:MAG: UvrB/UvrC motif-containing protein [Simkaniaceae bacterium]|nr:UvrB/UvrC motif-containing protein [Simkaniaceae bacterium]MCF7852411.1 UvrB/UvrC motif-containing protein [Simkaniaceae bacterium]
MTDRPLECNQCKKQTKIVYKEVKGKEVTVSHACEDCPVINAKLYQGKKINKETEITHEEQSLRCCPRCNTSVDAITMGCYIGCSECYVIFNDLIIEQLTKLNRIKDLPKKNITYSTVVLHKGRSHPQVSNATCDKLDELNLALDTAVKEENYEQAAWLRDRINTLMEESTHE